MGIHPQSCLEEGPLAHSILRCGRRVVAVEGSAEEHAKYRGHHHTQSPRPGTASAWDVVSTQKMETSSREEEPVGRE